MVWVASNRSRAIFDSVTAGAWWSAAASSGVSITGAWSRIACRWAGVLKRMQDMLLRYRPPAEASRKRWRRFGHVDRGRGGATR
ncbi:hypothetical protein GCM10027029_22890 [Conyzicola lurida]